MVTWDIIYLIVSLTQTTWVLSYAARMILKFSGREPSRAIDWIFFELRPVVPLILVGAYLLGGLIDGTDEISWRLFSLLIGFWNWWMARNDKDDDDRWRKRRKKLAHQVAVMGHRLQVVPAGGAR